MISPRLIHQAKTEEGTEFQIAAFNDICQIAVDKGWCAEVDDYAYKASNAETVDYIVNKLQVAEMEDAINSSDSIYIELDTWMNFYAELNKLDASEYEFTVKLKRI